MEGDIFATKGAEYLIVIAYLVLLVVGLRFFTPPRVARAIGATARQAGRRLAPWFALREGYHYHQGHSWAADGHDTVLRVGLDEFAAQLVGDADGVELPAVGDTVRQGLPGWTVRAGDRTLSMVSPVEGEVVAVNHAVLASPQLATDDPYGDGWLLKVEATHRRASLRNLLTGGMAARWMDHTVERLRGLPAGGLGVVLPDGGAPVRGFGRALGPEEWHSVVREFFLTE